MGRVLSVDYGLKRIGLAVSDPSRIFAFPCGVIENKNFDFVVLHIQQIIEEKEVNLIVVGVPYTLRSKEVQNQKKREKKSMEELVMDFIERLRKKINIEVKTFDERLTSFAAEENLKEIGMSSKKSKQFVDEEAARIILEGFLQMKDG